MEEPSSLKAATGETNLAIEENAAAASKRRIERITTTNEEVHPNNKSNIVPYNANDESNNDNSNDTEENTGWGKKKGELSNILLYPEMGKDSSKSNSTNNSKGGRVELNSILHHEDVEILPPPLPPSQHLNVNNSNDNGKKKAELNNILHQVNVDVEIPAPPSPNSTFTTTSDEEKSEGKVKTNGLIIKIIPKEPTLRKRRRSNPAVVAVIDTDEVVEEPAAVEVESATKKRRRRKPAATVVKVVNEGTTPTATTSPYFDNANSNDNINTVEKRRNSRKIIDQPQPQDPLHESPISLARKMNGLHYDSLSMMNGAKDATVDANNEDADDDSDFDSDVTLPDSDSEIDRIIEDLNFSKEEMGFITKNVFDYKLEILAKMNREPKTSPQQKQLQSKKLEQMKAEMVANSDYDLFSTKNTRVIAQAIRSRYRDMLQEAQEKNKKLLATTQVIAPAMVDDDVAARSVTPAAFSPLIPPPQQQSPKTLSDQELKDKLHKTWTQIVRREIPKAFKLMNSSASNRLINLRKIATFCQREVRSVNMKSTQNKARTANNKNKKLVREMVQFWRRNEKEERELRKKAEKEELDRRKFEEELREARRQQRKLNFLITQTELYSHFMSKKIETKAGAAGGPPPTATTSTTTSSKSIEDANPLQSFKEIDFDAETDEAIQKEAEKQALAAVALQTQQTREFDQAAMQRRLEAKKLDQDEFDRMGFDFTAPSTLTDAEEVVQPKMLKCQLKAYQLKGLKWLSNLYEQGINGILADEMGLGKTVQSISLLCHLAEHHNIWGPFLVVTPASTLFNWQQEFAKFAPDFKCLPYWGNQKDRKILRQFWNQKQLYGADAPFHVLVTSYQLVIKDEKYFNRIKWQYMVADEAQALKSSSSIRWNSLLKLNSRNRVLLTGTPIQNTMQELWALLHFIMPTLFDSHAEFSEWFSKDIESHAAGQSEGLDHHQLSRLHMILKPFMLRRVKKDVEHELGDKIEIDVSCYLTPRQRRMYLGVRDKISVTELLKHTGSGSTDVKSSGADHLLNLIMQFRKVCNHPELFKRRQAEVPLRLVTVSDYNYLNVYYTPAKDRDTIPVFVNQPNPVGYHIPKLLCTDDIFTLTKNQAEYPTAADRNHLLFNLLNIYQPQYIHNSLRKSNDSCFAFVPFVDQSVQEISNWYRFDLFRRFLFALVLQERESKTLPYMGPLKENDLTDEAIERKNFLNIYNTNHSTNRLNLVCSANLKRLCTIGDELVNSLKVFQTSNKLYYPKVWSILPTFSASDIRFLHRFDDLVNDPWMRHMLGNNHEYAEEDLDFGLRQARALEDKLLTDQAFSLLPKSGFIDLPSSLHIELPDPENLISDSGKMLALDKLLIKLKEEDHRVLIYCQMTKMIDILEEYMTYRNFKYLRLDGSSKINERRDMVADFQTRPDIFAFLLSVRAGGLGINLTSADTVIFYECDWNPTVDQQAMDRVHRLGQTKQVTVYRLVTKGTVEERILMRAKQKREIQEVVISGGEFRMDSFRNTREIVSLLLDDAELEAKMRKARAEESEDTNSSSVTPGAGKKKKKTGRPPGSANKDSASKQPSKKKRKIDHNEEPMDMDIEIEN